jgi:hypothetical protein
MHYNEGLFERQYPIVVFFVQHLAYYKGVRATWDDIAECRDFWRSTCDAHLELAAVAWCKVFGSYGEDTHWTKTPIGNAAEQATENFRCKILSETGFTQQQWETYHKEMLEFRHKYVAHVVVNKPFNEPVPRFEPALQVAYAYQEWARELVRPVLLNQPTLRSQYEQWEAEARSAVLSWRSS